MATDPIGDITGGLGSSQALYYARRTGATSAAATGATPPVEADDRGNGVAAKTSLDARERAWNGIVGGDRGTQDSGGVADKGGSDVTDAELQRLFGQDAPSIRQLLNARSDLKVGDLLPLRKDHDGLQSLSELLTHRSDVKVGDVLSRDQDGKVRLDPTVRDGGSREFLYNRTDVKPGELTAMRSHMARQFDNPALARQAYDKSLELMRTRSDLRPTDVASMVTHMGSAVKGTKGGQGPEGGAALFDMFDKSTKLLATRTDLHTTDVEKLVDATSQGFGGKDNPNGLSNLRDAFGSATELMQNRQGMSVRGVTDVMDTVNQHFGQDGDNKTSAFQKAANLMSHVPQVDAQGVGTMFKKAAEGPPPQKGDKLLQAFDNASSDVMTGKTNLQTATTLRGQQTDRQQHEQKTADERTRIDMGRLRTPQEQKARDEKDPQGLTKPGEVPTGRAAEGGRTPAANADATAVEAPQQAASTTPGQGRVNYVG